MSDQPTFRHRVLPMPKVGDWVVITLSGPSDQRLCQVRSVDGDAFLCGCEGNATRFERTISSPLAGRKSWCFADPAVEAQRLMEAAYRADTSPFHPDVLTAIEEEKGNIYMAMRRMTSWFVQEDDMETIADNWPHLLRWKAQQEGGKDQFTIWQQEGGKP